MKGPGFSRIRAGMQARIPLLLFRWLMNRKVPMNRITVTSARYCRCSLPCDGKTRTPGSSENITKSSKPLSVEMGVFTALPTDSRKTCASLFSLWCLISYVKTHPQRHCTSPLIADGRKDRVFTSLGWLRLANLNSIGTP